MSTRTLIRHPILALLLLPAAAGAQVLHVDVDATGAGDGSSWADAFPALGAALAAAGPGDALWVAEGTYLPPPAQRGDPRTASFDLVDDVALYGGFDGTETALGQRDPAAHVTILSGDIGVPGVVGDNAYNVVEAQSVTGAVLDGFTIRDGRATGPSSPYTNGALLLSVNSELLVVGCTFQAGWALALGGAVWSSTGSEEFLVCTFLSNQGNTGGAVALTNPVDVRFRLCTFSANQGSGVAPDGGALAMASLFADATLTVEGCRFEGNTSGDGGAVQIQGGNLIDVARFRRCTFTGNTGVHGGAMSLRTVDQVLIDDCTFEGNSVSNVAGAVALWNTNAVISRSRFVGNATPHIGGALACVDQGTLFATSSSPRISDTVFLFNDANQGGAVYANGGARPVFSGCTLAGNTATTAGGGLFGIEYAGLFGSASPQPDVDNSILWGNAVGAVSDQAAQIHMEDGIAFVDHSLVQGLVGGFGGGVGNIDGDPLFVDLDGPDDVPGTADDDVRPAAGSPCIDAGNTAALLADANDVDCDGNVAEPQPLDLGGLLRVADDPGTADTGAGGPPVVDMGAHEHGSVLPADVWTDLGGGTPGLLGVPVLTLSGTLCANQPLGLDLADAAPSSLFLLWISLASAPLPIFGGTLHAIPFAVELLLPTDGTGAFAAQVIWPEGLPPGTELTFQAIVVDGSVIFGLALSNASQGITP